MNADFIRFWKCTVARCWWWNSMPWRRGGSRPRAWSWLVSPRNGAVHDFETDPEHGPLKDIRRAVTMNANAVMAPEFTPPT